MYGRPRPDLAGTGPPVGGVVEERDILGAGATRATAPGGLGNVDVRRGRLRAARGG